MAQADNGLPPGGDDNVSLPDIDAALDGILGDSEILSQAAGIPTQDEYEDDDDDASSDDDLADEDESGDEEENDDGDDAGDEGDDDGDEDDSTEGDDDDEAGDDDENSDEIDWEFKLPVKIDGEESEVDLKELVKGYQTSQHLSKKGRELANERKEFEALRTEEIGKVTQTAKLLQAQSMISENALAEEYKELDAELKAAKKSRDNYKADEIQEKLEDVQKRYWQSRKTRERIAEAVKVQEKSDAEKRFAKQVETFNEEIGDFVPDFNEEKATELREFALSKGIPQEVLQTLADARIIGALNEFMELSKKVSKGSAKRKAAPKRTPTTTKKAKPTAQKKAEKQKAVSKRIASGDATQDDLESALDSLVDGLFG